MHNVFHVSQLKKCLRVLDQAIEVEGVELEPDLTYAEYAVRILCNTSGVCHQLSSGLELQHDKLSGNQEL